MSSTDHEQPNPRLKGADVMPVAPLQDVLVALTDPMRLEMVRRLMSAGEALACSSLYDGISKSTASHHFKTLREAGVIERVVRGAQVCQRLRISELDARYPGMVQAIVSAADREQVG